MPRRNGRDLHHGAGAGWRETLRRAARRCRRAGSDPRGPRRRGARPRGRAGSPGWCLPGTVLGVEPGGGGDPAPPVEPPVDRLEVSAQAHLHPLSSGDVGRAVVPLAGLRAASRPPAGTGAEPPGGRRVRRRVSAAMPSKACQTNGPRWPRDRRRGSSCCGAATTRPWTGRARPRRRPRVRRRTASTPRSREGVAEDAGRTPRRSAPCRRRNGSPVGHGARRAGRTRWGGRDQGEVVAAAALDLLAQRPVARAASASGRSAPRRRRPSGRRRGSRSSLSAK